jgi:hypothetical protein
MCYSASTKYCSYFWAALSLLRRWETNPQQQRIRHGSGQFLHNNALTVISPLPLKKRKKAFQPIVSFTDFTKNCFCLLFSWCHLLSFLQELNLIIRLVAEIMVWSWYTSRLAKLHAEGVQFGPPYNYLHRHIIISRQKNYLFQVRLNPVW